MKKIILTVIFTLIIIVIIIMLYIYSGSYDVSQTKPDNAITNWIMRTTVNYSVKKRLKSVQVPSLTDTSMIVLGFQHYKEMCAECHGAPGIDQEELAMGLYPKPPKFYKSDDMPDPDEAFWIIKNGIKLTGMPAFGPTHSDKEVWAITAFLLNKMNNMSPDDYKDWVEKHAE